MMMKLMMRHRQFCNEVKAAIVLLAFVFLSGTVYGQLNTTPLKRYHSKPAGKTSSSHLRTHSDHTLTLPFWDDFSFTRTAYSDRDTIAGFPLDSLWQTSDNVWIKSGIEIDAPSLNVATFDGIDSTGNAYSAEPSANGFRDSLVSRPIDLSESQVTLPERNSVYLSFFYQWRGNGEPPDALDNFRVEFRNADKQWITVATIRPQDDIEGEQFYDTLIKVNGDEFFHDQFQFRFRNYGRLSGPFDTWNIDYIYLDKGRSAGVISFEDGAFASPAGPLFNQYYSVPYPHFLRAPAFDSIHVDVFNLRSGQSNPDPYTYTTTGTFTNYIDGVPATSTVTLTQEDREVRPGNSVLSPRERVTIKTLPEDRPDPSDPSQFHPDADSVSMDLRFVLLSNDDGFYQSNDTVTGHYFLKDYYAYDDGTAEYAVSVNEPDDQVAIRYDLFGADPDQLVGFDVYIPRYNVSGFLTGDFFVLDANEGGDPNQVVSSITHVVRKTDRDEFQRVYLSKPVNVEKTFYIGWKGSFTSTLYVGKDSDNNTGDKIYVNPFGSWIPNNSVEGTIMLRPVFGEGGPIVGIEDRTEHFDIYPNPSAGSFYISGNPDHVEMISTSGQKIFIQLEDSGDKIRIDAANARAGLYLLRISKGAVTSTHKIIIR
jgi:hypothetical protein